MDIDKRKIAVIGLGYVGWPLFKALTSKFTCWGLDSAPRKIDSLKKENPNLNITSNWNDIQDCNFYIVAVPTPIDENNNPEISSLKIVCENLAPIIDKEDISKVQQYTWHAKYQEDIHSYYVETNQKLQSGKFMLMLHRFLTDTTCKSKTVDHINHDTLDNRKCNLKVCSQKENNLNQAELHKNNKTGYRNISYQKMYDKFIVTLMINGKNKTIGRTSSLKEAILMRDKAKRQYGVSNVYNFTRLSNKCK